MNENIVDLRRKVAKEVYENYHPSKEGNKTEKKE